VPQVHYVIYGLCGRGRPHEQSLPHHDHPGFDRLAVTRRVGACVERPGPEGGQQGEFVGAFGEGSRLSDQTQS
jgi:hypothetical protein